MALLPPNKADDSLGRVKTDRPSPFPREPDLRYDIPAYEMEQIKDCIIAAYEAGAGATRVIAKWNELDLTQFGTVVRGNNAGSGDAAGTMTPTVAADSEIPSKNRIRFALTGFGGWAFLPWTGLSLPERFVLRAKFHIDDALASGSDLAAILLVSNLVAGMTRTDLFGYIFDLYRGVNYLIEAGVRYTTGAPAWAAPGVFNEKAGALHHVEVVRAADPNGQAEPRFSVFSDFSSSNAPGSKQAISSDQYSVAFAAGWNGQTLDKAGIGISSTNTLNGNIEIAELCFLKHPMDE